METYPRHRLQYGSLATSDPSCKCSNPRTLDQKTSSRPSLTVKAVHLPSIQHVYLRFQNVYFHSRSPSDPDAVHLAVQLPAIPSTQCACLPRNVLGGFRTQAGDSQACGSRYGKFNFCT
ncbi:hypothetical protein K523DRAFT_87029 [Schizophyllum commune Tattone D]|nr:hypothetical protein K523DRAFT_87029 [Schizophyllum commune Tattone D]